MKHFINRNIKNRIRFNKKQFGHIDYHKVVLKLFDNYFSYHGKKSLFIHREDLKAFIDLIHDMIGYLSVEYKKTRFKDYVSVSLFKLKSK